MNYKLCIHEKNEQAIASHQESLGIIPPQVRALSTVTVGQFPFKQPSTYTPHLSHKHKKKKMMMMMKR